MEKSYMAHGMTMGSGALLSHTPVPEAPPATESITNHFPVSSILPEGRENRVSSQYLADTLGFDSIRSLQKQIELERKAGKVILSTCQDSGGYWRPEPGNIQEVKAFIRTLTARSEKTMAALNSAKAYLESRGGC